MLDILSGHFAGEAINESAVLRLRELFDHSPAFVAVLSGADHRFIYTNPAYQHLIGDRIAIGMTVREVLPEVVEQGFLGLLDKVFSTGKIHTARDMPVLLRGSPDDKPTRHWIDFVYQPLRGAKGAVHGIFVEGSDVTERHVSAEALQRSEAFYRQVIDAATDYAIVSLSIDGRITLWNKGAESLLGWSAAEMLGQSLDRLFPDDETRQAFSEEMKTARRSGHGSGEGWRVDKAGRRFLASGEIRLLRDDAGEVSGFVKVLRDCTGEREASLALQRSEERLRRAQEAGHIGVFTIDTATGWLEPTEETCRVLGIEPTEGLPAEDIEALVLEEDRAIVSNRERRLSGDLALDVEYRIRRPADGAVRVIARRAELERDETGKPIRMVGVVQDVTERHAMQRAAKESEARALAYAERVQLALAAGAIIGTWVWDIASDQFTIDEQFAETFGVDPALGREGISLEQIIATVHPDDKQGVAAAINEAIDRGGAYAHQYRVKRADGRYYWIEANGRVERDAECGRLRFPGVLLDIEQRRALEQDRDAAHRLLRTVMEAVPGVVYAKDREGRMLMGNAGTTELLGLPPEVYLGRTDLDNLEDEEQARIIMANDRRIMEAGVSEQFVENVRLANGAPAMWLSQKAPLRDENGKVIGLVGVSIDITDRIRAETDLRDLNLTLEQRIASAIAEREQAEEALRHAQKMEAIGQLTGGIAHDFNNLLSIIMGSVDLAIRSLEKTGNADTRLRKLLGSAMIGADRAAALIQRLLAFSRRQPLAPRPIAIASLVEGMRELLDRSLGETIAIEIDLEKDLWMVEADPNQLESALLNLAVNARDAMPSGGKLTVKARNIVVCKADARPAKEMAPGSWVEIEVCDTGTGIPPDIIARVFEPFFTTKEQGKGTGLGLSMVYGFVRQSGGHVSISSQTGCGTVVALYLRPLTAATGTSQTGDERMVPQAPVAATILVVEDDEGVRSYIVHCLKEQGYLVVEAQDASSALAVIRRPEQVIDLLLTDVVMPGQSGRELADHALSVRPSLRVLFMSGYPRDTIVHNGKIDEGVELITKPFTCGALAQKLVKMLKA